MAVGALVVVATLGVEAALFRQPVAVALRRLGLGRPTARGLLAAALSAVAL